MSRGIPLWTAPLALLLGGCAADVVLELPSGGGDLSYRCSDLRPAARSEEERAAVRSAALRVMAAASEGGPARAVNRLVEASASGSDTALEIALIRQLCAHPVLRDAAQLPPRPRDPGFPEPGSPAPELALPVLQQEPPYVGADSLRLTDLAGRYVYLEVFGSWCAPCVKYYHELRRMAAELRAPDFAMVGLLLKDPPESAARFFAERGQPGFPFLVLDDRTAARWDIVGAPMGYLISPEGELIYRCFGCQSGPAGLSRLPALLDSLRQAGVLKRSRTPELTG